MLYHSCCVDSCEDEHSENDDSHGKDEQESSDSKEVEDHDNYYGPALLLSHRNHFEQPEWDSGIHAIHPGFPQLIQGRELDRPCYQGRYNPTTDSKNHSTTPDDHNSSDYNQRRPQQEPPLPTLVCQRYEDQWADMDALE